MSSQQCLYCWLVNSKAMLSRWKPGCSYHYEFSGYSSCHLRQEKQVAALQSELTSLLAASVQAKATSIEAKATYQAEISRITAESSLALTKKNAEYEQLLSEVEMLKADHNSQQSMIQFLKLDPMPPYDCQMQEAATALDLRTASYAKFCVLAAKSPTVQNWLNEGPAGLDQIIDLWLNTTPVCKEIVKFCHSGNLTFSELVRPEEVLPLADKLEIGILKPLCEAELRRRLTVDNVPEMLKLAQRFAATELQKEAEKLFREHFDIVMTKFFDV